MLERVRDLFEAAGNYRYNVYRAGLQWQQDLAGVLKDTCRDLGLERLGYRFRMQQLGIQMGILAADEEIAALPHGTLLTAERATIAIWREALSGALGQRAMEHLEHHRITYH